MERIKQLSFSELCDILNFLKSERDGIKSDKDGKILEKRISAVEEELRIRVTNLFY